MEKHIDLLLSKNLADANGQFTTEAKYLTGAPFQAVSYTSYPRSGNTFLRKYLENITGVATGSDQLMKFTLNVTLQYSGFKGEGIVKDKCWINKTHFPYRTPMDREYDTQVILLAVRNPLDVFVSFFQMINTQTHTKSMVQDIKSDEVIEYWNKFFDSEIKMWVEWHDYWMEKVKTSKIPIYFFRFEDLLTNPEPILKDIFRFILAEKDIDGTVIEQRIRDVIKTGKNTLYKPRSAGGGFNKHANKLEKDQMGKLMSKLEYYLHFFGYVNVEGQENTYDFYNYNGKASKNSVNASMDY